MANQRSNVKSFLWFVENHLSGCFCPYYPKYLGRWWEPINDIFSFFEYRFEWLGHLEMVLAHSGAIPDARPQTDQFFSISGGFSENFGWRNEILVLPLSKSLLY